MEAIIDSDEFYDEMMDAENVAMATAVNTDSFECLIYIPAVIPVSSDTGTIKIYWRPPKKTRDFSHEMNLATRVLR